MKIIPYNDAFHREQVIELWRDVLNYTQPRNNPSQAIDRKLKADDGLFFVAEDNGSVAGTLLAGYDGHRGWIYSLAVLKNLQHKGIGTALLKHSISELELRGCPKINLQVLIENKGVQEFYKKNGFIEEPRISMGMELNENTH